MNPLAQLGQLTAMAQSGTLTPRCAVCLAWLAPEQPNTAARPAATLWEGSLLCREHLTAATTTTAQEATA